MADTEQKSGFKELFATIWWLVLLRGIVILLLGILLVSRPLPTLIVLVYLLGFYWFFDGIFTLIASIRGRKSHKDWGWGIFVGIISALAGVVVFTQPYISAVIGATFVIYVVAVMVLISGIWSIITGIRLRKEISNEWSMILGGLLSAIFGILLMINPLVSAMTLVWLIGVFALAGGIILIVISFRIRKLAK
ncbi:MAG: HdeD family acid-resistance protein [Calditrichia bacterium]|nr:HdeD family acid-resistance protein [Calditrichia bacterium]